MTATLSADTALGVVKAPLAALPVFIAGSAVSSALNPNVGDTAYDDVDVFCATPQALMAAAERLMRAGFELNDRFERVYHRWIRYGFKGWHTNSLKLEDVIGGIEVNLVFKIVDGHPTTSASQVIESFDFGLLHTAWDCEREEWLCMADAFFPGMDRFGALPLLPNRRDTWRNGFISQYQGLREAGRYVKYVDYGYDLSLVKDDLVTGYRMAELFYLDRDKPEHKTLGQIYGKLAIDIEMDDLDRLREFGAEIPFMDELTQIMETLE